MNPSITSLNDPSDTWRIENSIIAGIAGPVAALTVAGALVGQRDTLGVANVGFIVLLIVLVASLIGGRPAGLATAIVGALSFNFFHTQPYQSFAVSAREDVISVVLCAIAGVGIGEVGARLHRRSAELSHARAAIRLATHLFGARPPQSVATTWASAASIIEERLGARPTYRASASTRTEEAVSVAVMRDGASVGLVELALPEHAARPYLSVLAAALSAAASDDPTGLDRLATTAR
jgi:K+-sensing histidine kinase KdpD